MGNSYYLNLLLFFHGTHWLFFVCATKRALEEDTEGESSATQQTNKKQKMEEPTIQVVVCTLPTEQTDHWNGDFADGQGRAGRRLNKTSREYRHQRREALYARCFFALTFQRRRTQTQLKFAQTYLA
jgi:hypothetical protein